MMHQFKDQFPQAEDICYLNHAAVSPWPKCTADAVCKFAQENMIRGAQGYLNWLKEEQKLRSNLKLLINAESTEEIALAKNTSEALSIIAYGLDWQAGDEIIISNQEFPSNRIVWESLSDLGVKLIVADIVKNPPLLAITQLISPKTRLVSISSVQYATGLHIDLEQLSTCCREKNILLCIDAIQSLGVIPFDQEKIQADFIVADGHKWLMAAEGLALMYIKKKHIQNLKLHQYGWHMVENRGNYDSVEWTPAKDASRFECGSPNMIGIHALNASLELILDIKVSRIRKLTQEKILFLIENLKTIKGITFNSNTIPPIMSGILNFSIEGSRSDQLYQELMKSGVICAHRGGGIRFSPHFYTSEESLRNAVSILKNILNTEH